MSIFGKVKQAFGFSEVDDYFDSMDEDRSDVGTLNKENSQKEKSENHKISPTSSNKSELPLEIFDGVIKIFNDSLPEFIKTSLDVNAQRDYIYNSLSQGMKDYLEKSVADARQQGEVKWKEEKNKLQAEITQLKSQHKNADEQRAEWQKQQLSAERQKRALTERLHDLEKQVATLEAEKEQYDLENKSLLNKLKVSSVIDGDMEVMRQQIIDLQAQLKDATNSPDSVEMQSAINVANSTIEEKEKEIAALKEQLLALENKEVESSSDSALVDELNSKISDLEKQNKEYDEAIQQLKAKEGIADAMINDLNAKVVEATKKLEEKEQELSIKDGNDAQVSENNILKEKLSLANEELESLREELEEARSSMAVLDEIQEQMFRFEEIKKKKDARITALQDEIKKYVEQITELENEAISLKKTIENNLYKQVESEKQLRKELEELKSQKAVPSTPLDLDKDIAVVASATKSKKKVKISAIDESLDDTDWLVATPPPGTITRPTPATTDEDFGYQSPSRKQTPENDAQMSLF